MYVQYIFGIVQLQYKCAYIKKKYEKCNLSGENVYIEIE